MNNKKYVVESKDKTRAIFCDKCPYGYRLKHSEKNLAGEWCCSFSMVENEVYKTLKAAKNRALEILG